MKTKILKVLKSTSEYVSGQELLIIVGVSSTTEGTVIGLKRFATVVTAFWKVKMYLQVRRSAAFSIRNRPARTWCFWI